MINEATATVRGTVVGQSAWQNLPEQNLSEKVNRFVPTEGGLECLGPAPKIRPSYVRCPFQFRRKGGSDGNRMGVHGARLIR